MKWKKENKIKINLLQKDVGFEGVKMIREVYDPYLRIDKEKEKGYLVITNKVVLIEIEVEIDPRDHEGYILWEVIIKMQKSKDKEPECECGKAEVIFEGVKYPRKKDNFLDYSELIPNPKEYLQKGGRKICLNVDYLYFVSQILNDPQLEIYIPPYSEKSISPFYVKSRNGKNGLAIQMPIVEI